MEDRGMSWLEWFNYSTSKEYLEKVLEKIPTDTISGLIKRGQIIQEWKMSRQLHLGKEDR